MTTVTATSAAVAGPVYLTTGGLERLAIMPTATLATEVIGVPFTGEIPTVLQVAGALVVMLGLLAGLNLIKLPNPKGHAS